MTINIIVLKGDLNGKIVVVRFFFLSGIVSLTSLNFTLRLYNLGTWPHGLLALTRILVSF